MEFNFKNLLIAGTIKISVQTIADTGFPGRPITVLEPNFPEKSGFPGRIDTFENFILYAGYGIAVGLLMYVWTDFRIKRQKKKREALRSSEQNSSSRNTDE